MAVQKRHGYSGAECASVLQGLDEQHQQLLCQSVYNNSPKSVPRTSSAKVAAIRSASAAAEAETAQVAAMAEAAARRVQALREAQNIKHDACVSVRAQLAGLPVGAAPAAIAHTAQTGLCYRCVSRRVAVRSTADHFSFRRGFLKKGEIVAVVETADHPTHGRSLRCSRKSYSMPIYNYNTATRVHCIIAESLIRSCQSCPNFGSERLCFGSRALSCVSGVPGCLTHCLPCISYVLCPIIYG